MKRKIIHFIIILLAVLTVAGAAQGENVAPPEGKTEGVIRPIGGVYYIGGDPKARVSFPGNVFYRAAENQSFVTFLREQDEVFGTLFEDADHLDGEHSEEATRISLAFVSGDESMREVFYSSDNRIGFNLSRIDGGVSAVYHLEMESEHLRYSGDFTVSVERLPEGNIALDDDSITIAQDEQLTVDELKTHLNTRGFSGMDSLQYMLCPAEDDEDFSESLKVSRLQENIIGKDLGDYSLRLIAFNEQIQFDFPFTLHVTERKENGIPWPPEGKQEGKFSAKRVITSETIIFGKAGYVNRGSYIDALDHDEEVTDVHVSFLSGDEQLRYMIRGEGDSVRVDLTDITLEGEATFRIDVESESLYASDTITVRTIDGNAITANLTSNQVVVPVGEMYNIGELFSDRQFVTANKDLRYYCYLVSPDGLTTETDQYRIDQGGMEFTAKQAGDYSAMLRVHFSGDWHFDFPITIHASEEITTASVDGDAPPTAWGKTAQAEEEARIREEEAEQERLRAEEEARKEEEEEQARIKAEQEAAERLAREHEESRLKYEAERPALIDKELKERGKVVTTDTGTYAYITETTREYDAETYAVITAVKCQEEIVIPGTIDGYPVRKVSKDSNSVILEDDYRELIRSVSVENGVTSIEYMAFSGCRNLEKAILPGSLTEIGMYVFSGCHAFREVAFNDQAASNNNLTIHDCAFWNTSIEDITFPDGTSIQNKDRIISNYFGGWTYQKMEEGGIRIIGYSEIWDSSKQTYLPSTEGMISTWDDKTQNRTYTGEFFVPRIVNGLPVTEVGNLSKFGSSSVITRVTLSQGILRVGESAFENWSDLQEVALPDTLISIGRKAFASTELAFVELPESLTLIEKDAFAHTAMQSLQLPGNPNLTAETGWFYGPLQTDKSGQWIYSLTNEGEAAIDGITTVKGGMLKIPSELDGHPVTVVHAMLDEYDAEAERNKIKKIVVPEGITTLDDDAFSRYSNLQEIKLPSTLTVIGSKALSDCEKLTKITLPKGLKHISDRAFSGCIKLKAIVLPDGLETLGNEAFMNCDSLQKISIPAGIIHISEGTFARCYKLSSVRFPEGLQSIGARAFTDCRKLKKLDLPSSLLEIGERAFYMTVNGELVSVRFPDGLQTIGQFAFYGNKMPEIVLPASVQTIGDAAFFPGRYDTTKVTINGAQTAFGKGVFGCISYSATSGQRVTKKKLIAIGRLNIRDRYNSFKLPSDAIDIYADGFIYKVPQLKLYCHKGSTADLLYQHFVEKKYLQP